jgi:hypothetical protein
LERQAFDKKNFSDADVFCLADRKPPLLRRQTGIRVAAAIGSRAATGTNGVPNGGMDACIGSDCDGVGPALLTGTVFIQAPGASVNTVSILDGFTLQVNGAGTLDTTVSAFVPGIIVGTSSTFLVDCGGQATLGGVIMSGSPTMTVDGAGSQIYGHG